MYTLRQAAKATGVSKSSIQNAIRKGKISGPKDENGHYMIDPAELHRVYPPVSDTPGLNPVQNGHYVPPKNGILDAGQTVTIPMTDYIDLKTKADRVEDLADRANDLKEERDKWRGQAERLLLTEGRAQKRRGFWQWLRGGQGGQDTPVEERQKA